MLKVFFEGDLELDFVSYEELKVYMEENPNNMIRGINYIHEGDTPE